MDTNRQLEPRRRPDAGAHLPWGLFCAGEGRWLEAAFATEQAAREAIPILSAASGR